MSTLRGEPGSVWTLTAAVDALAESARQAGRPGVVWLAGLGYQFLNLGWTFGATVAIPVASKSLPEAFDREWGRVNPIIHRDLLSLVSENGAGVLILGAPVLLILFRLVAGLARLAPRSGWRSETSLHGRSDLRATWHEGAGLTLSTLGLWTQIVLMMFGATLLFIGPTQLFLELVNWDANPLAAVIAGVATALMLVYSFLLSILFQIALHSLVQNRRGVASALLHAWRIAKNDPRATARATMVDAVLFLTTFMIAGAVAMLVSMLTGPSAAILIPVMLFDGFAGCARCSYWGKAYRALGGLSTIDEVPG